MRLLFVLFSIFLTEAKKREPVFSKTIEQYLESKDFNDAPPVMGVYDFGHVYRSGVEDPDKDMKQPFELAALAHSMPVNKDHQRLIAEGLLRRKRIQNARKNAEPKGFANPRDEFLYHKDRDDSVREKYKNRSELIDFAAIHDRNIALPQSRVVPKVKKDTRHNDPPDFSLNNIIDEKKGRFFSQRSFELSNDDKNMNKDKINWTTCNEFGKGALFYPNDIVDKVWVPFYTWTTEEIVVAIIHKFSIPTVKTVQEYKQRYRRYLPNVVDWNQPKLLLKDINEALLIAADRRGLFYQVRWLDLPDSVKGKNITIPIITIRLKIVDPYLAMMDCDDRNTIIMAVFGEEPGDDENKKIEAEILHLRGRGYPISRDIQTENLRGQWELKWKQEKEKNKRDKARVEDVNDKEKEY